MKTRCPRCGGTVTGRRGQPDGQTLDDHYRLACPAPKPKTEVAA